MRRFILGLLAALLTWTGCCAAEGTEGNGAVPAPGSTVTFGRFEQDGNPANGPEPIEWTVLENRDGKCLMISRYALDTRVYHTVYGPVTWEECSLRGWLNGSFFSAAFTEAEQAAVPLTRTDNSAAQGCRRYKTTGGNDTEDRVFVLSYAEAERYFDSDGARRCPPTAYAAAKGACVSYSREDRCDTALWWLRSPGNHQYRVSVVYSRGALNYTYATKESGCVRPALWLDPGRLPGD